MVLVANMRPITNEVAAVEHPKLNTDVFHLGKKSLLPPIPKVLELIRNSMNKFTKYKIQGNRCCFEYNVHPLLL